MSIVKLSAIGPGFAALQRIGLAGKALEKYRGSDWLKDPIKKNIIKPVVNNIGKQL